MKQLIIHLQKLLYLLDNKWILGFITIILFAHMIVTPWLPLSHLKIHTYLITRIIISIIVLLLVCVHPYYAILLISVQVIALNEYTKRSNTQNFKNINNETELNSIYSYPLHDTFQYKNNELPNMENISADADKILELENNDIHLLINQHNMQTTNITGGLHGIFNMDNIEENKINNHPSSNTITQNIHQNYIGIDEYLTDKNLYDAQMNIIEGIDSSITNSNFPELGNKDLLQKKELQKNFPYGTDSSITIGSKYL